MEKLGEANKRTKNLSGNRDERLRQRAKRNRRVWGGVVINTY